MRFSNFLGGLFPKDKKFFTLFEKASANLLECAKVLNEAVQTPSEERRAECVRLIEKIEHQGDDITHEIYNELGKNFITPFDREDIHSLASAIDDVLDCIDGSSKRMILYQIREISPEIIKLTDLILDSTKELQKAVFELRNLKDLRKITDSCVRINSIENHADDVFDNAIAKLFKEETNAIEVIKYKEILSGLEAATDMCEDAANVLESIIVKIS